MRLIDADELKTIKSIQSADFNSIETIRKWIDEAPTVDAVEVVRCKDCVHRNEDSWCRLMGEYMPNNGFCSRGGRKDDNNA